MRANEMYNLSAQVGRDLLVLREGLQSACPHVLANIVTRQIVDMGDPLRRGCDQSESIGANMKSTIHRRVARKTITGRASIHKKRSASGAIVKQWKQKALEQSRVMQAFCDESQCVRERILRNPDSARYLQAMSGSSEVGGRARRRSRARPPSGRRSAPHTRRACATRTPRAASRRSRREASG